MKMAQIMMKLSLFHHENEPNHDEMCSFLSWKWGKSWRNSWFFYENSVKFIGGYLGFETKKFQDLEKFKLFHHKNGSNHDEISRFSSWKWLKSWWNGHLFIMKMAQIVKKFLLFLWKIAKFPRGGPWFCDGKIEKYQ